MDDFIERLTQLGQSTPMSKTDLSRAFRQLKVEPCDYPMLCLLWNDKYFTDSSVAFGHRIGGLGCIRLVESFRYLHRKNGYYMIEYLDDMMSAETPDKIHDSYSALLNLLKDLNVPISLSKLEPSQTDGMFGNSN